MELGGRRRGGWKDAGDAIVDARGEQRRAPLATIELQGYLYAARLAMAELMEARGETAAAQRQRGMARGLRQCVEERYWMPEAGLYALGVIR